MIGAASTRTTTSSSPGGATADRRRPSVTVASSVTVERSSRPVSGMEGTASSVIPASSPIRTGDRRPGRPRRQGHALRRAVRHPFASVLASRVGGNVGFTTNEETKDDQPLPKAGACRRHDTARRGAPHGAGGPVGHRQTADWLPDARGSVHHPRPGDARRRVGHGDHLAATSSATSLFEGLPDGIGIRPGTDKHTVDVYVAHEQTTVPFFGSRDFQDASVSRLTLSTKGGPNQGSVLDAEVALGPEEGFLRFCSASMAGPADGLDDYVFFTGEETNDTVDGVQHGFAVVLNTRHRREHRRAGHGSPQPREHRRGPGRLGRRLVMLTTDDTFMRPSAQLYMYIAADQDAIFDDEGSLYALRITGVDGAPLADPADAFNGANDYLDLDVGEDFQGEFIAVPDAVADGDQTLLEDWSNDNNVFQAIRLEDLATDKNDPRTIYIADTGRTRVVPDPATGRMVARPGRHGRTGRQRPHLQDGDERRRPDGRRQPDDPRRRRLGRHRRLRADDQPGQHRHQQEEPDGPGGPRRRSDLAAPVQPGLVADGGRASTTATASRAASSTRRSGSAAAPGSSMCRVTA